ncbi:Lrp/AsnC family transcriptional regulator [Rhizobium terrae]|uniref:Lrp/AsnC family transcriptional regulator n=1 Tax=Rhizobium terrae TaxID=2171756 RepID=UPI000E3C94E5|nr:Lrp/AsnC family transcriptional regulator [Rhizobium terrae]
MKLDAIDLRIIEAMKRNGRLTKQALAETVGLSATPAWARLKRLEAGGVITGYHARVSATAQAPRVRVLMEVTVASHRHADFKRFETAVVAVPEIVSCWAVGGGVDYFLTVETEDIDSYQRLVDRLLTMEIGIQRYFTYIVTRAVKDRTD